MLEAAVDTLTETDLVRQAQDGSLDAFTALVNRYERKVYTVARRMLRSQQDAEDVTQETFLSALDHLADFRGEASFYSWLLRIATNAALKIIRRRQQVQMVPLTSEDEGFASMPLPEYIADWRESPAALLERQETANILCSSLHRLDEKYRLVFVLRDVEGMSIQETALVLGLSEANVKTRLLRARLQLREMLTRLWGDERTRMAPHRHEEEEASR